MSKILDLAKNFEATSKQQASDTKAKLKDEFSKHEAFIAEELRLSEQKMKSAIHAQQQSLTKLILKTWLWIPLMLGSLLVMSWGIIHYQGSLIKENYLEIAAQKKTLRTLKQQGGKIQIGACGKEKTLCVKIDLDAEAYGKNKIYPWMIPEGY